MTDPNTIFEIHQITVNTGRIAQSLSTLNLWIFLIGFRMLFDFTFIFKRKEDSK